MWLINTYTVELHEFLDSIPPYAILSHVWDEYEASFEDLAQTQRDPCNDSIKIIERACAEAQYQGFEWLWNSAACVDKRSSAAQSEAINSLAQTYRNCAYSIIYLEDLDYKLLQDGVDLDRLAECRWIKNVWAIPQIIFPQVACFYSSDWHKIGSKRSILPHLSSIIGIDEAVLEDSDCLEDYSIARRLSWASEMTALRVEDFAYALLGLFDVSMSIIYGEGQKAFFRLQEELMKDTDDFSLLAWDNLDAQEYIGLFANSPLCFHRFRSGPMTPLHIDGEVHIHSAGITIETSFWKAENGLLLPLQSQYGSTCRIPLSQWSDYFVRRGIQVQWQPVGATIPDRRRICIKRKVSAHVSRRISEELLQENRFYPHTPLGGTITAKASRRSIINHNSNDETSSVGPSAEDLTSRYASSVSLSEDTSPDDLIAWSTHDRGSVGGTLDAFECDVRHSWVHGNTSTLHHMPQDCPVDDAENGEQCSTCSGSVDQEVIDGFQNSMQMNGSPSTEAQILDVAPIAQELANATAEQFLPGRQRQANKRCFVPWQGQIRKRPKLTQSSDQLEVVHTSDSEDGEMVVVRKSRFFACPFYILDNKYTKCVTRHHLHTIEDVKEHVCWDHRRPMFCPVCKKEFSSGRDRDAHIRLRACQANTSTDPEGITDEQEERLEREDKSTLSDDLRWCQIWDIIFPGVVRPSSAFYTGEREVSVCAFRQFWMQNGEGVVAGFLEQQGCQDYSIRSEERTLRAIYDLVEEMVVDKIFDDSDDMTGKNFEVTKHLVSLESSKILSTMISSTRS